MFKAIGRLITSPLSAVIVCAGGAYAIWYGLARPPGGAPNSNLVGGQGTGQRTIKNGRPDPVGRGSSVATGTDKTQGSRNAPSGIAARDRARAQPRKTTGRREVDSEEFEAKNEPPASSAEANATDRPERRPQVTGRKSTTESTSDAIGPRDPRAKAMLEYPAKKAAVADDAIAQKGLALWCDEHGLWEQAKVHWEAVRRLDPKSDSARNRLGFRWRAGHWVFDAASAEDIAQRKADAYWGKELKKYHAQMRCRSKIAVPARAEAVAQVEAVGDPRAAAAIWNIFAADAGHHGMIVGILSRFKTSASSQMLAAVAVYSQDKKAQVAAVAALQGRRAADYGERLVALMHAPLRVEERQVPIPGRAPARELFVEGDTANYQFLFSRAEAPTSESLEGCFQPRLSASEIEMARQFNENQAAMARDALNQQIELAKQMIEKYNDSIRALNERVARVLNEACGAGIRPEPEDGRRWLALALGTVYQPAAERPKPTFTEIVSPLYNPTFLPVPVAC